MPQYRTAERQGDGLRHRPLLVRLGAGLIAVAAAIGTLWGAATAIAGAAHAWNRWTGDKPAPSASPSTSVGPLLARTPDMGLQFVQGNAERDLHDEKGRVRVSMARGPFEIRFPVMKPTVALQICASRDDAAFATVRPDGGLENTPFQPGKGMADSASGSSTLMISGDANNYLVGDRVIPVSQFLSRVYFGRTLDTGTDREEPLSAQREDLYLTVFADKDHDHTFDIGEFEFIILDF